LKTEKKRFKTGSPKKKNKKNKGTGATNSFFFFDFSRLLFAVLLDQEKAYDRVHPEYLRLVMLHMGFPPSLVMSITKLFLGTGIHLSINDWLSAPVYQNVDYDKGIRCHHYFST
jgi:hypothetical protein